MSEVQKSAAVYRRKEHYFVHARSRTSAGFWVASVPARLLPLKSSVEELGAAVMEALSASAYGVQTPSRDEHRELHAPLLAIAKVRSWSTLQRSAALCNVMQSAGGIVVEPTRNGGSSGDERGYHPLSDQSSLVDARLGPNNLGVAVVAAFERCC